MKKILLIIPLFFNSVLGATLSTDPTESLCYQAAVVQSENFVGFNGITWDGGTPSSGVNYQIYFKDPNYSNDWVTVTPYIWGSSGTWNVLAPGALGGWDSPRGATALDSYVCISSNIGSSMTGTFTVVIIDDPSGYNASTDKGYVYEVSLDSVDSFVYDVTNFTSESFQSEIDGLYIICGNDILEEGEQCDDGNLIDDDGCSSVCQWEGGYCGDNIWQSPPEQCDDGNLIDGDGCSSTCELEAGICGDGVQNVEEQCDDGNLIDGDGCSSLCELETPPVNNSEELSQQFQNIYNGLNSSFDLVAIDRPILSGDTIYSSEPLGYDLSYTDPNGIITGVSVMAKSSCFVDDQLYQWININMSGQPFVNSEFGMNAQILPENSNALYWWDPDKIHSPDSAQEEQCDYQLFLEWNLSNGQSFTIYDRLLTVNNVAINPGVGIFSWQLDIDLPDNVPGFFTAIWKGIKIPFTGIHVGIEPIINFVWGFIGSIFLWITENVIFIKDISYIMTTPPGTTLSPPSDFFGVNLASQAPDQTIHYSLAGSELSNVVGILMRFTLFLSFVGLIFFNRNEK
jgi:cysteine-rich repeat protein